jgi:hypothetical protein
MSIDRVNGWSRWQALAWIRTRDHDLVCALAGESDLKLEVRVAYKQNAEPAAMIGLPDKPGAERELQERLDRGEILNIGYRVGAPLSDVILDIPSILRFWPERRVANYDETAEEGAAVTSTAGPEPGAASSPQVAANIVEQVGPEQRGTDDSLRNSPRSGSHYSEAKLRDWYTNRWLPSKLAEGSIPSRSDELKAARQEFGEGVPRDAVVKLRKEIAPAKWKQRGRRKKIDGGN